MDCNEKFRREMDGSRVALLLCGRKQWELVVRLLSYWKYTEEHFLKESIVTVVEIVFVPLVFSGSQQISCLLRFLMFISKAI